MILRLVLLGLVLGPAISGCRDRAAAEISRRHDITLAAYIGKSIALAEKELVSFVNFLDEQQKRHPSAVGYDEIGAMVWLRLWSIYEFRGKKEQAALALANSIKLLRDRSGTSRDGPKSEAAMKDLMRGLDQSAPPLWKLDR